MNKEILRLAIPNIISNISIPLLSTVDTALMGMLSPLHIGAVGLSSMIFNFIYWNFGFLRMGTTGITAQGFGDENLEKIKATLGRAVLIGLVLSLIILLFQKPMIKISVFLMNVPESQVELVTSYYNIRIWAAPASLLLYVFLGWFFGLQNAIVPLLITVIINVANIALSYVFIVHFHWDIEGVAWSTVIAQYTGLVAAMIACVFKFRKYLLSSIKWSIWELEAIKSFLTVNSNLFIRTVLLTFSFAYLYAQSAKFGPEMLAVNVILLQFLNWMSHGIDGFAYASESIVGKYKGANDKLKTKSAIRLSFIWGGIFAMAFALIYKLFGMNILHLFTDESSLISLTEPYLIWVIIIPLIGFVSYVWDGVYIGLTASQAMRDSMIISLIVFIGLYNLVAQTMFNLWLCMSIFLMTRGLVQSLLFYRKGWHLK